MYTHIYIHTIEGRVIRVPSKGVLINLSINAIPRKRLLIYTVVLTLMPEIPSLIYEPPTHIAIVELPIHST